MEIRSLRDREDVRGMTEAHGEAWRAAYDGIVPDEILSGMTVDPDEEELDRRYEHYAGHEGVLVAEVDGVVRGYAFVRWGEDTKAFVGPDEAGLKEIYVHPDHWGEGIGTALLEAGIDLIPEDVTALRLEVLADNEVGQQFYEARGFDRTGTTEVDVGDRTLEAAIYTLEL